LRQEIVRRLAAGETAVWLVLESGDAAKDRAARELLTQELKRLESELKLPPIDPGDDAPGRPELKIAFSVLSVPRNQNEEAPLAAMLLHSEPDLAERTDPLVFPVFGQGRALWPLVGAGITPENITRNAGFLVGSCSCEVKEQNPGFDLLLAADWKQTLKDQGVDVEAIALRELERSTPAEPQLVPIPSGTVAPRPVPTTPTTTESIEPAPRPSYLPYWIAGLSAAGVILLALVFRRR
jgi:hypothetical protein